MANRTFGFRINAAGKFSYFEKHPDGSESDPPEWRYGTGDKITFKSPNGPFIIELLPVHSTTALISPAEQSSISPFEEFQDGEKIRIEGPANAVGQESTGHPTVTPKDPTTVPAFQLLLAANNGQFVTRYRYAIVGHVDGKAHLSTDRNGSWQHPC